MSGGSWTKGRMTGSLVAYLPGGMVIVVRAPNVTGTLVPGRMAPPSWCRPIWMSSKVTGLVPKTFDSRMRACRPQMSGRMISRKDWLDAPLAGSGKARRGSAA